LRLTLHRGWIRDAAADAVLPHARVLKPRFPGFNCEPARKHARVYFELPMPALVKVTLFRRTKNLARV
jgi:hypothetical protein